MSDKEKQNEDNGTLSEQCQVIPWIKTSDKEPAINQRVITHHQLKRIDMLKFDGKDFNFPPSGPCDKEGRPYGFSSAYPKRVITHWMPLPELPEV